MKKKKERRETEAQRLDRKYGAGTADMLDELAEMGRELLPAEPRRRAAVSKRKP